jgi:Rv2632c-like
MTTVDSWPVEVSLTEEDGETRAEARLTRNGIGMTGHGLARRHPEDQEVTQIGEEIAAARAPVRPRSPAAQRRGRPDRGHHAQARPPVAVDAARSTGGSGAAVRVRAGGRERGGPRREQLEGIPRDNRQPPVRLRRLRRGQRRGLPPPPRPYGAAAGCGSSRRGCIARSLVRPPALISGVGSGSPVS